MALVIKPRHKRRFRDSAAVCKAALCLSDAVLYAEFMRSESRYLTEAADKVIFAHIYSFAAFIKCV